MMTKRQGETNMNVETKTNIEENNVGRGSVCSTCKRAEVARVPDWSGFGDRRTDQSGRGWIHCSVIPAAIRQERSASADRSLFIDGTLSARCGVGEGVTDLEAAESQRYAAFKSDIGSEPGCSGILEERRGLHLSDWKGSALLPIRATGSQRGWSDC